MIGSISTSPSVDKAELIHSQVSSRDIRKNIIPQYRKRKGKSVFIASIKHHTGLNEK